MKTLKTGLYPAGRLHCGSAILAAAKTVDVIHVQKRFDAFASAHQQYTGTHGTVAATETEMRERHIVLTQRDRAQDEAIEAVACRLALDGQPRSNPFAAYGLDSPFTLTQLKFGEKAKAIHTLVGLLRADTTLSAPTQHAAQRAEEAARQMEIELVPFETLQTSLRTARAARTAAATQWDKALTALKLDARAADIEGAPGLEAALLGHLNRSKKPAPEATQPATTDTQPTTDRAATPTVAPTGATS
jgi:hypothetical protein